MATNQSLVRAGSDSSEASVVGGVMPFGQLKEMGQVIQESGLFPDLKNKAQAIVKIMAGQELGLSPVESINDLYLIKGKVAISANLIARRIKLHPSYDYEIVTETNDICEIDFFREGRTLGRASFSYAQAEAANICYEWGKDGKRYEKSTWRGFRATMLFARALTTGMRRYCPDVMALTVYTPEELRDIPPDNVFAQALAADDVIAGEVVQPPAIPVEDNPDQQSATVEYLSGAVLRELSDLWFAHVSKQTLVEYCETKGYGDITTIPKDAGEKLLTRLRDRDVKARLDAAIVQVEAAGVPAEHWQDEMGNLHGVTEASELDAEQAAAFTETLQQWADKKNAAKRGEGDD